MISADTGGWGGHPRGLSTLFFIEMWERFSYYGMRAFLILYMVAPLAAGGLGFSDKDAASIYGTYTGSVWGMAILGGIVADRFLGQFNAVLVGGTVIALGHFTLAFKTLPSFYAGLVLIVIGTGLLKPNVSTLVGSLYEARRSAARRRLLDLLHGDQQRRVHGPDHRRLPRAARGLACRVCGGRRRHGDRPRAVLVRTRAPRAGPRAYRRRQTGQRARTPPLRRAPA